MDHRDSARIPKRVRQAISDPVAVLCVSAISIWEIVIKHQAGKLQFDVGLEEVVNRVLYRSPWTILPVTPQHLVPLASLPMVHRDPFDRLLIAQAQYERMTLVTPGADIAKYGVPVLW